MSEYLENWKEISEKKKKGWSVAQLGKNIEKTFQAGNKVINLQMRDKDTSEILISFYYTPVTKELQKSLEKLGNYLHAAKKYKKTDDPFWKEFRIELLSISQNLKVATLGTLLGPPLLKAGGQMVMNVEMPISNKDVVIKNFYETKKQLHMVVSYFDSLPQELDAEAHLWRP